ncbi:translation initiation factor IF-2 [Candidatus Gottesmanbacteria bacterium RIFCSPHIGHO2_02_FULL_40_24]|uniref:Translation initiation factor IF-2 n=1 Tax=Candidatus Gottesmanbacteria bacterium RIFCSPHIGHO2_01_FULL_40_15 TaxID=1798376 RepID=A0A1F5Z6L4_9BACT|nr:MAG: translation initiation factor IF-2 [Candidatus Gottesmanbacteria bacterium RIFCSPHIGHO2_01_FULL_40_15]OGG18205.1 MAG: translation initiation factor IF-2 [Candidatus Gottesmanbacteria bacterium RIFCSPHIGHO2_02_FULL_40_24]OGG22875.1 MAG: translation initiation factor IF-2 [Candidatus Gottesmanbacteria bacterium RIFCSPLOWO2_01_FULL_40_10]OGG23489.1 MAG: translation initiation factor IF-2 [Candidatus Gottesmanbacteria bacterium RIFCSPHIGHO2_12_FULL_40_13]OGG32510.1 MAG: translation initiati
MAKKNTNEINEAKISIRPPIVSVLGHVDHGKTSLLDRIRKTNLVVHEHGGITQHIGAYQIEVPQNIKLKNSEFAQKITFIDTPGHHAFAKMRSQGANASDIAILVIAANDGIKPQTSESIEHIKNSGIPTIIALNKIDLPDINIEKIKKQLNKEGVKLEQYGGDIPLVPVSAKTGEGMDKLLETILFLTDFFQIRSFLNKPFQGVVIESSISKYKGITGSVIVRNGVLNVGDDIVYDNQIFRVRAINDWQGRSLNNLGPGDPGEIIGWKTLPSVGTILYKKNETEVIGQPKTEIEKVKPASIIQSPPVEIETQKINLIIKADTVGTLEAITLGLPDDIDLILKGVGPVNESDILLGKTVKALVIGFNVPISDQVKKLAQSEKVLIKKYEIIYQLFDEIKDVVEAIKKGDLVDILGIAKVLATFDIKGVTIIGAKIVSGRMAKGDQVKILRDDNEIGRRKIKSLKHFKEDITKAEQGKEVGIGLSDRIELLTGDSIIAIG